MEIITRAEAKKQGLSRYFTGKPCKHGHVAERYTKICACVECIRLHNASYREANLKERNEYTRRWKEASGMNSTAYYRRNPESGRAVRRRYYHRNIDIERRRNREYQKANPEAKVASEARRRARARKAGGTYSRDDILRMYDQQKGRCLNCNKSLRSGYHVDHIMPLARGGSNGPENLQLLCPPCNWSKKDKHPLQWAQENGRLL